MHMLMPTSIQHKSFVKLRSQRGFTIVEVLLILVLIGVITTLSMPSMRSLMSQSSDLKAATRLLHILNQTRNQSTRRNRAYRVEIRGWGGQQPQGQLSILEAPRNTCASLVDQQNRVVEIDRFAFGQSQVQAEQSAPQPEVGLLGWKRSLEQDALLEDPLFLCISSSGAIFLQEGDVFTPLYGTLSFYVQRFRGGGGNWSVSTPPQQVHLQFSSGAQLKMR